MITSTLKSTALPAAVIVLGVAAAGVNVCLAKDYEIHSTYSSANVGSHVIGETGSAVTIIETIPVHASPPYVNDDDGYEVADHMDLIDELVSLDEDAGSLAINDSDFVKVAWQPGIGLVRKS